MERVGDKAVVFLPWDTIEPEAQQQILNTARCRSCSSTWRSCPIATTAKARRSGPCLPRQGAVIPAAVGVDIGCGMIAVRTPLKRVRHSSTSPAVRAGIERRIPMSAGKNNPQADADRRRRGCKTLGAARDRHARDAGPVRQELETGARHARRRQPLHRARRGRRRRGVGDAALRLARRGQQDWHALHPGGAGPLQEDARRSCPTATSPTCRRTIPASTPTCAT